MHANVFTAGQSDFKLAPTQQMQFAFVLTDTDAEQFQGNFHCIAEAS